MSKEKTEYCFVAKCLDLGCPRLWADTKESIEKAMEEATPEQMLELKKAESDFEIKMKE